jgi:hypothetical protein
MIRVRTTGPTTQAYLDWYERAKRQRQKALDYWHTHKGAPSAPQVWKESKPSAIWNELKLIFLQRVFQEKCAYCEGKYGAGHPWHVEHYRPKSEVTENRQLIDHPGYFWLAYEWHNLLLACAHCNSWEEATENTEGKSHPSKSNEFRVRGNRIAGPGPDPKNWLDELKQEQPLLINPYDEEIDPEDHFAFQETGHIFGTTNEGRETVEVCNLKRVSLVEAHLRVADRAYKKVNLQLGRADAGEPQPDRYFGPEEEFSAWLNFRAAALIRRMPAKSTRQNSELPNNSTDANVTRWPSSFFGQCKAILAALERSGRSMTPDELVGYYDGRPSNPISELIEDLVRDKLIRDAAGGTYTVTSYIREASGRHYESGG